MKEIQPVFAFPAFLLLFFCCCGELRAIASNESSPFVFRESVKIAKTEAGEIRSLRITNDHVQKRFKNLGQIDLCFITMEPNSLLLPLYLNRDCVLYVRTGEARLGWVKTSHLVERDLRIGDIYRIPAGRVFYVFNTGGAERLRLIGIMNAKPGAHLLQTDDQSQMIFVGGGQYPTSILSGFDKEILRAAFNVPKDDIKELISLQNSGPIVHAAAPKHKSLILNWGKRYMLLLTKNVLGEMMSSKKKKMDSFNILKKKPNFQNKYGWTQAVKGKDYHPLRQSDLSIFMVNLTKGSMLSPHWNPRGTEIGIVIRGQGMVQIAHPDGSSTERIKVGQGDVFMVPQFYPMAQLSFGNESFEFLGFSTCARGNQPQFLAGKNSVLNVLNKDSLALAFGVSSQYLADFLAAQKDSIIFTCPSCAEELEERMEREEERRKKEEEEDERKKEEEEEERRKKEEEEEEEERKKEEEEQRKKDEEEAERRKKEEEEEEEERRRREEEEEERRREEEEEEERKRREEEEEEESGREKEEEEERKRREEGGETGTTVES